MPASRQPDHPSEQGGHSTDALNQSEAPQAKQAISQPLRSHVHTHPHAHPQHQTGTHSHVHTHSASDTTDSDTTDSETIAVHGAHANSTQSAEHTWHIHAVSHRAPDSVTQRYLRYSRQRWLWLALLLAGIVVIALFAIRFGAYPGSLEELFQALMGQGEAATQTAIWRIRMPRIVGALICGWGLSLAGLCIQTMLKNPLASPSTIGISQGAAFGAAASIVLLQAQIYLVTAFAFAGAMGATAVVLVLASLKRLSAEAVVLSGVALSSLFTSGTILLQFLASDTQLAMVVFWTFGDVARAGWQEIGLMSLAVAFASIYLYSKRWDMNALISGEEAAKGMGVNVTQTRMSGVVSAALIAAIGTAFFGVIAFVGLVAPHMARRLVGADHRLTIPFSCVLGALLLLASDTIGRVIIGSGSLPVGVITSCLGAPMFLYMLVRSYR